MSDRGAVIVIGAGPGLGAAVGRRFAAEGYGVALATRTPEKAEGAAAGITDAGGVAIHAALDGTDEAAVAAFVERVESELGPIAVAVDNASGRVVKSILDLTTEEMEDTWRKACLGGFILGRETVRRMVGRGRGTILFSGATASLRGGKNFASFAVGKFGLRALAQSMAREFGPQGIHVAHINIDGQIFSERYAEEAKSRPQDGMLSPDAIADAYWHLHSQHRSAWTQELDLRPWVEKF